LLYVDQQVSVNYRLLEA